jgi:hypothetical protein
VTSDNSGLIETIRNTMSIHSIKKTAYTKQDDSTYTLRDFFEQVKVECGFPWKLKLMRPFYVGIVEMGSSNFVRFSGCTIRIHEKFGWVLYCLLSATNQG